MRVNVYAEETTGEVEVIGKTINGTEFTGVRFFLYSPDELHHTTGDDDRSAVTFWGKRDLRDILIKALTAVEDHYRKTR